jgi:hypothetical protein
MTSYVRDAAVTTHFGDASPSTPFIVDACRRQKDEAAALTDSTRQMPCCDTWNQNAYANRSVMIPWKSHFRVGPKMGTRSVHYQPLIEDVAKFFDFPSSEIEEMFLAYRELDHSKNYTRKFDGMKTLNLEEAFVIYAALAITRPRTIVEIGTQYGGSAGRIIDIANSLRIDSRLVCFDVEHAVTHFCRDEAELIIEDVTGQFREKILEPYDPEFIFLDAHPYYLVKNVIAETLNSARHHILAIHDCSRELCNRRMRISKDDPRVTSKTGVWERHVLAEEFEVEDPLSQQLDFPETSTHRLRIFDTQYGLAVILPLAYSQWAAEMRNHPTARCFATWHHARTAPRSYLRE